MVTFKRLMLWFGLFTGVLAFLVLAGSLDPLQQMIFGAAILLLIIFLMGTGGGRKVERIRKRSERVETEPEETKEELPAPVQSHEDASSRRNAKLSRSRTACRGNCQQRGQATGQGGEGQGVVRLSHRTPHMLLY